MNIRTIGALLVGIVIGGSTILAIKSQLARMHAHMPAMDMHHSHGTLEVEKGAPVPQVKLEVSKDEKDGYNVHVIVANYTFTPEKVNAKPQANEGHAHVFVNGEKVYRLYGPWIHLPGKLFAKQENEISVTLNANDHSEWTNNGTHIEAKATAKK
jgi:hypothetical protein